MKKIQIYIIQEREAGNYIDTFTTKEAAEAEIGKYEAADKKHNCFTSNFYEIFEQSYEY